MQKFTKITLLVVSLTLVGLDADAQRAGTTNRDSVGDVAATLLAQGRANEARITLLRAMRASTARAQLATYRLEVGDSFLYEGNYQEAARAYSAVLAGHDSIGVDSLIRWAHHGLALVDAFNGRTSRSATHYAEALAGHSTLADTIEMLVLTAQHDSALRALDRYSAAHRDANGTQFEQVYRSLSWMLVGHCTQALPALAKAPHQDRPIAIAIRGRCQMKHGQRIDALATRDSVLKAQPKDPFAWTVLIARDAARKIE